MSEDRKVTFVENEDGTFTPCVNGKGCVWGAPGSANAGLPVMLQSTKKNGKSREAEVLRKIDRRSWLVSSKKAPKSGFEPGKAIMDKEAVKAAQSETLISRAERAEKRAANYRKQAAGE